MKQRIAIAAASFALIGGVFLGAASSSVDAAPNENSCFGQGRADYIHANSGKTHAGYISERKGDNPEINADWIATECD